MLTELLGLILLPLTSLPILLLTLITFFLLWAKTKPTHYSKCGIYSPPFQGVFPRLSGHLPSVSLGKEQFSSGFSRLYRENKGRKYLGVYLMIKPFLVIRDLELVERILIKDFSHFQDRGLDNEGEVDPLEKHLFNLRGQKWKALRSKLSPIFTSGKLKWMYSQLESCSNIFLEVLEKESKEKGEIEIKDLLARYTTDVIGSCAFGYEPEALEHQDSDLRRLGRKLFQPTLRQLIINSLRLGFPKLYVRLGLNFWPPGSYEYFEGLLKRTFEDRLVTGRSRGDFIQLLLQLREKGYVEMDKKEEEEVAEDWANKGDQSEANNIVLDDELLTAQAFLFFVAGYETTATSLCYTLYQFAKNPEKQELARREVREVKEKYGSFNYEAVKSLKYLEACFNESIRLNTPVGILFRICTKDYELEPGIVLKKGEKLIIPVQGIHEDPEIYPEPDVYSPERFLNDESNKRSVNYIPFGQGPRICIGKRFAEVEIKSTMAKILDNFKIEKGNKFMEKIKVDPRILVTTPEGGIMLKFVKINKDQ